MSAHADELAATYSASRARLVSVAYAILGTRAEAEDVVSDVWLKLAAADAAEAVRDVEAWSVVAVGRAALDVYRSARRRRETYVGPWLPEPILAGDDPADRVTLDESVSFALLVVLESLTPAERTAFVLHDLFAMPFEEVATVVGRTAPAVRQLASRARRHLADRAPRVPVDPARHRVVLDRFLVAASTGRLEDLVAVLDPDVELVSDGGGVVSAARRPVLGADHVARFLLGIYSKFDDSFTLTVVDVNGLPGLAVRQAGALVTVMSLTLDGDQVTRIDVVRAPAKLTRSVVEQRNVPPRVP